MAKSGKPLITDNPKFGNKSLVTEGEEKAFKEEKLNFSFLHYREINNFGVGNCSAKWHGGLLDRLSVLSGLTPREVLEDNKGSDALRCHHIKWSQNGIPIQLEDLNWLPFEVLNNPDEFPIMQFSISTATGRIVGFFNKDSSTFNVVLLDPKHNIQPSKKHNYQVKPTTIGTSQYDDLLSKFDNIKNAASQCQHASNCDIIFQVTHAEIEHNIVYIPLDNDYFEIYQDLLKNHSIKKIFENGIITLIGDDDLTQV